MVILDFGVGLAYIYVIKPTHLILMADNPTNFWQELKRRKVVRVIAMYAAAAYVIIELSNNVVEPLSLPEWVPTFIIVLLVIGFPFAVIFSWVFDVTSEGIKKTESIETGKKYKPSTIPVKRKLKFSDIIIAVLLVVVVILLYPKIFNKDKFEALRDEQGRISVAVMPFQNLTRDTIWDIWQFGIQNELISNLSNSEELKVRSYETMQNVFAAIEQANYLSFISSLSNDISRKLEVATYINGKILKAGDKVKVSAQLNDVEKGETIKSFQAIGKSEAEIFYLIDSLSNLIKNYLELKVLEKEYTYVASLYHSTNSAEAYRHFLEGANEFSVSDYSSCIKSFSKAVEIDSSFVSAIVWLCSAYSNIGEYEDALKWCNKAILYRDKVPILLRLRIDWRKARFDKLPQEEIKFVKQSLELDDQSFESLYLLGAIYSNMELYRNAIDPLEKAFELTVKWGGPIANWHWVYTFLGKTYHNIGNHRREEEVYEQGLRILPENTYIIYRQAICAFSQGDSTKARYYINQFRSLNKSVKGWSESRILSNLGDLYTEANLLEKAEKCFRNAYNLNPQNPETINNLSWFLIDNEIDVNEGVDLIEKALMLTPDEWNYLDTKGWGLYKQGKYEEALEILNYSWNLQPVYNHECYKHIQEVEQAVANQSQ